MISKYGIRECLIITFIGLALGALAGYLGLWWAVPVVAVLCLALLAFFRDPPRRIPTDEGIMVSPADGHISSIHEVENFQPFGETALCVRVFLSVLDVHVNRSPCDGVVHSITHTPGLKLNALNPKSAEVNEANLVVLHDPQSDRPVAAVRQIAGLIARCIVCGCSKGDELKRGERFGLIKFGSTTELYVPLSAQPRALVELGQKVHGASTVLVRLGAGVAANDGDSSAQTEKYSQQEDKMPGQQSGQQSGQDGESNVEEEVSTESS